MVPVEGTVNVDVPASVLWEAFTRADLWPRWNRCMLWVRNRNLVRGRRLLWAFRPIRRWYPYVLPAIARIVEVKDKRRVTWEVTLLPGFYARHTYHMKDVGGGRTRFGSWEKAMGRGFRLTRWFWVPHFVFVKDRSLEGAVLLEEVYLREGKIDESTLPGERQRKTSVLLLLPALAGTVLLLWFYLSYVRWRGSRSSRRACTRRSAGKGLADCEGRGGGADGTATRTGGTIGAANLWYARGQSASCHGRRPRDHALPFGPGAR